MWLNAAPWLGARMMRGGRWTYLMLTAGGVGVPDGPAREFADSYRHPDRARAASALYRAFLLREQVELLHGRYLSERLRVPTRLVFGADDFAIDTRLLEGYEPYTDDMEVELVPDTGHFIVDERPDLVTERIRSWLLGE